MTWFNPYLYHHTHHTATITVTRAGGSSGAVSVNYATSNGTALAGSDYTATTGTISFASGDVAPKTFTVPLINDAVVEGRETVNLALQNPSAGATLGAASNSVLTILNDDTALRFSAAIYSANEGGGSATITVQRTGVKAGAVSVRYSTGNGSALAGSDYTAVSGTISFASGDNVPKTFTVPLINDTQKESSETVKLTLSSFGGSTLAKPSSALLTIVDND